LADLFADYHNPKETTPWKMNIAALLDALKTTGSFNPTEQESGRITTLLQEYILPKCYRMNVFCTDAEPLDLEADVFYPFIGEFITWLNSTKEKYSLILDYYEKNKDKLMDKMITTTSTTNKTNDTPQIEDSEEDALSSDAHLSTLGSAESRTESDSGDSVMSRLSAINNRYKQIYLMWLNDFIKKFRVGGDF